MQVDYSINTKTRNCSRQWANENRPEVVAMIATGEQYFTCKSPVRNYVPREDYIPLKQRNAWPMISALSFFTYFSQSTVYISGLIVGTRLTSTVTLKFYPTLKR